MADEQTETPEQYAARIRAAERAHEAHERFTAQTNDAAIGSANVALRSLLLINGGAAIAMLAFMGSMLTEVDGDHMVALTRPLSEFAWGVAAAAFAAAMGYLANYSTTSAAAHQKPVWRYPYHKNTWVSWTFIGTSIVCLVLALGAAGFSLWSFVVGMLNVADTMVQVFSAI